MKQKKLLSFLLAAIMLVIMLPCAALAAEPTSADKFTFDKATGTITGITDKSLTEIVIPESIDSTAVTAIGDYAFLNCSNLSSVTMPSSVTSIGNYAFTCCTKLTNITIPNSVTSIGDGAFNFCTGLTSIDVDTENTAYCSKDGVLFNKNISEIIKVSILKSGSYTIPSSVTSIADYAFETCSELTSVTIPSTVTSIGKLAFYNCTGLSSVTIPSSVTSIGDYAFYNCTGLSSVTIPSSVKTIEKNAFFYCSNLSSITIPSSVETIGFGAFLGCNKLSKIYYPGTQEQWNTIALGDANTEFDGKVIYIPVTYNKALSLIYDDNEKELYTTENDDVTIHYYDESGTMLNTAPKNSGIYTVKISWAEKDLTEFEIDTFKIKKASSITTPTTQPITYGSALSTVTLPTGWVWENGNTVPTVTNNGFTAYFDTTDNDNYDWTAVDGFNATESRVERTVAVTINKATPTKNPDKKTTARVLKGKTLADASVTEGEILGINNAVLDGTFAWEDETKVMDASGTASMIFTPNDTNYAPLTVNVDVTVYQNSGGGSLSSVSSHIVRFNTNGGNSVKTQSVVSGGKATEPTEPTKDGFTFDGWYSDSELTAEYDFDTKVTKSVTLYAKWTEKQIEEPIVDSSDNNNNNTDDEQKPTTGKPINPFVDIKENDWFFDNVRYANENGLMSGTTSTTFAPSLSLTRGMLVAILYRSEGEPTVNKSIPFADVTADSYYADAVIWAEQNGIVSGINETEFAPDENITREQIAAIFYRFAQYKGIAPTGAWAVRLDYADLAEIADYAVEGVMYCTMKSIMQGKGDNMFAPKDNATRAEIAAILQRFIENNK